MTDSSNQAMERTADRCAFHFKMTFTHSFRATLGFRPPSLILFSLDV